MLYYTKVERRKPFQGKVAFISGGSRGIGFAIAEKLAAGGAQVVFSYLRSRSDAETARQNLSKTHTRILPIRANMGNAEQVRGIFQTIHQEFGYLDFIIHNAAAGTLKPVLEISEEEWQRTMEINLHALFLCAKFGVPLMKGRGGKIISISSHGSQKCLPDYAAVGVAKAAMEALSRYLAAELASQGISVNVVLAGTTETKSLRGIPRHAEMIYSSKLKTPMGRLGQPEDIAEVVSFLCSDASRWICGQTIVADGGYSIVA